MRQILADIQDGSFADEWIAENEAGLPKYHRLQEEGKAHPIEKVGAELRGDDAVHLGRQDPGPGRVGRLTPQVG